jgi:sugar/nucleoside kinase (ribokinase family)
LSSPRFEVVGLGASAFDILSRVDHFPAGEEIQQAIDMKMQGGGPVATAIVTLARLGARTAMLDMVGDDWRSAHLLAEYRQAGVNIDLIESHPGGTCATSCVLVRQGDGARTAVFQPGHLPELRLTEAQRAVVESAQILHINGRHWAACLQAVAWARAAGVRVSFDGGAQRYRPEMSRLVPDTDICLVARDFAEKYTGHAGIEAAGEALLACGPALVGITDGVRGSWLFTAAGIRLHQPAYPVPRVVDTTGCGDSYHGAFLFGLARAWPLPRCAALAAAVAAMNAQALGGRGGLPSLPEAEAFLASQAASHLQIGSIFKIEPI